LGEAAVGWEVFGLRPETVDLGMELVQDRVAPFLCAECRPE